MQIKPRGALTMPLVQAFFINGSAINVSVEGTPDTCPLCHRAVEPKLVSYQYLERTRQVQAIYRCTSQACQQTFIATFVPNNGNVYHPVLMEPTRPAPVAIPPDVADVSPTFVEIRTQVEQARTDGLSQLVGIGLRKALEFLIKDYACKQHPDKSAAIKATPLGACITTYVDDTRIKTCAARAAWLGNDETHYTRRWEDRDINDLNVLVNLTINWIHSDLLTKSYASEMQAK